MRLTIEVANSSEVRQILNAIKSFNLTDINVVVDDLESEKVVSKDAVLSTIHRPIQKKLDLESIKKSKNYQGVNRVRFNKLVEEINIQEPIEMLISQLSK